MVAVPLLVLLESLLGAGGVRVGRALKTACD